MKIPYDFPVITICGSMRFQEIMLRAARELTGAGCIVLAPFVADYAGDRESDATKLMLDKMHRRKIDMSSRILVVTDDTKYVGDSTRGEIKYARMTGKAVDWYRTDHIVLSEMDAISVYPTELTEIKDTDDA